jgi:dolichol kinase
VTGIGLRRLLHVASATVLLAALVSLPLLRAVTGLVAAGAFGLELVRLRWPGLALAMARRIPVYRPAERTRISGAAWLALGYAIAAWLPPPGPVAGILAGGLADPAASLIGARWGAGRPKSGAGTLAVAAVTGMAALAAGVGVPGALAAGLLGAGLERWPGPFDDNLLLAPGVAAVAALLA